MNEGRLYIIYYTVSFGNLGGPFLWREDNENFEVMQLVINERLEEKAFQIVFLQ